MCVDVDDDHAGCAVMQYEVEGDKRARCAGRVNTAQIARSKAIFNYCNDNSTCVHNMFMKVEMAYGLS